VTKEFGDYNRWQQAVGLVIASPFIIPFAIIVFSFVLMVFVFVMPYRAIENVFWDQGENERWTTNGKLMSKQNVFMYLHYIELIVIVGLVFAVVKLS